MGKAYAVRYLLYSSNIHYHHFSFSMKRIIKKIVSITGIFFSDSVEDLDKSTTLKVHFKDLTCIKYRRDMYMTWDGLLGNQNPQVHQWKGNVVTKLFVTAAFGGIFGLCLGGSVISLVEMVYYFTLRLYNRVNSIYRQDGLPLTRQVSPAHSFNKASMNDERGAKIIRSPHIVSPPPKQATQQLARLRLDRITDPIGRSKLQVFEKAGHNNGYRNQIINNVGGFNPFGAISDKTDRAFIR